MSQYLKITPNYVQIGSGEATIQILNDTAQNCMLQVQCTNVTAYGFNRKPILLLPGASVNFDIKVLSRQQVNVLDDRFNISFFYTSESDVGKFQEIAKKHRLQYLNISLVRSGDQVSQHQLSIENLQRQLQDINRQINQSREENIRITYEIKQIEQEASLYNQQKSSQESKIKSLNVIQKNKAAFMKLRESRKEKFVAVFIVAAAVLVGFWL